MNRDKLKVYILEFVICIIFFLTLFVSSTYLRAIVATLLIISFFVVKKLLVTILLGLLSVVFLLIFYMLGLYFGFGSSLIKFDLKTLSVIMIPTAIIIVVSEIIRSIFLAENISIYFSFASTIHTLILKHEKIIFYH